MDNGDRKQKKEATNIASKPTIATKLLGTVMVLCLAALVVAVTATCIVAMGRLVGFWCFCGG